MAILAEHFVHVIGVDTHKATHCAAVLNANGALLKSCQVTADRRGYTELLELAAKYCGPVLWAVEGTGSYGAALTEHLLLQRQTVTEVDRPKRSTRRRGKSDEIDAIRAGRDGLAMTHLNVPRSRGRRERMRVLLSTRAELVKSRTALSNHLHHLVITASEVLRCQLLEPGKRSHSGDRLLKKCLSWRPSFDEVSEDRARLNAMRDVARLIRDISRRADRYEGQIKSLVEDMAPGLLAQPGIGALTGAQILVSWSHAGRLQGEAAFAAVAGVAPIPASSGQTVRHRLNRGGDRKLNTALHTVVLSRCRYHRSTIEYFNRRSAEGKTPREIRRCLKRYLARQLFRFLTRLDKG